MLSTNSDSFISSFSVWMILFFSCLIALARTSNTMLNNSDEYGPTCPVPDLRGKAFSFLPSSIILAVACHKWPILC